MLVDTEFRDPWKVFGDVGHGVLAQIQGGSSVINTRIHNEVVLMKHLHKVFNKFNMP